MPPRRPWRGGLLWPLECRWRDGKLPFEQAAEIAVIVKSGLRRNLGNGQVGLRPLAVQAAAKRRLDALLARQTQD